MSLLLLYPALNDVEDDPANKSTDSCRPGADKYVSRLQLTCSDKTLNATSYTMIFF